MTDDDLYSIAKEANDVVRIEWLTHHIQRIREDQHAMRATIEQLLWVLLTLGQGHPDETISAALWRMEQQGKIAGRIFRPLVDLLFRPIEKDHCYKAWLSEIKGKQLPPFYKK